MDLQMPFGLAEAYKSSCQRARVITEAWGERELFCAECDSTQLSRTPANTRCVDLVCGLCNSQFQLKSGRGPLPEVIPDGAYSAMIEMLRSNRAPNLFFLRYDATTWRVRDLLLVPRFAFPESAIIKRKPLSARARRAGWTGCNISLAGIPKDARIAVVAGGLARPPSEVRNKMQKLRPLIGMDAENRGWSLEVLNCIRRAELKTFTTADAYQFGPELQRLHPRNAHVEPKIRQKLQVLRDAGFLSHPERGRWIVKA